MRALRTCWRSERGIDCVVAAAPPAQLDAPARLQPVQLRKALAPRRVALWHARDGPRRIQHLPSQHRALAQLLDHMVLQVTHVTRTATRACSQHQGCMMSLDIPVVLIIAFCKGQQHSVWSRKERAGYLSTAYFRQPRGAPLCLGLHAHAHRSPQLAWERPAALPLRAGPAQPRCHSWPVQNTGVSYLQRRSYSRALTCSSACSQPDIDTFLSAKPERSVLAPPAAHVERTPMLSPDQGPVAHCHNSLLMSA